MLEPSRLITLKGYVWLPSPMVIDHIAETLGIAPLESLH